MGAVFQYGGDKAVAPGMRGDPLVDPGSVGRPLKTFHIGRFQRAGMRLTTQEVNLSSNPLAVGLFLAGCIVVMAQDLTALVH